MRLEREQVADARLVVATAVVDDEHRSGRRFADDLENHVDAAQVRHRRRLALHGATRQHRPQGERWGGHAQPHEGIHDGAGGERGLGEVQRGGEVGGVAHALDSALSGCACARLGL